MFEGVSERKEAMPQNHPLFPSGEVGARAEAVRRL